MNFKLKLLPLALCIMLTLGLSSCNRYNTLYGTRQITKNPDTLALKKRIAQIKSISPTVFEAGTFTGKSTPTIKYRLLQPQQKKADLQKYPLVIVFHGSGATGTDNINQLGVLAKLWADPAIQQQYPAYVLAPQFPTRSSNYVLDSGRNVLKSIPQPCLKTALELIDSLKRTLNIDEKRIYVIGFSMGASSVINSLSSRPELFAAGVSISGIPEFSNVKALANIPIWLMHGKLDTENPGDSDQQFYKEVNYQNKTRFWEFEGTAHNDIISIPILGEEIPKWLFKHQKK
ncbi:alpha/beta hydrolase-fold protein [Pedobacter sp. Hv1]|uniref:carboxylesterase family protein n=1 Tax=Pedobacter sp. Hv1 TaxID=1740090 RepID=UPI00128FCB88|nr:alpha/beta hydrolase-fold protein [Pedobacter sp. Hv1]